MGGVIGYLQCTTGKDSVVFSHPHPYRCFLRQTIFFSFPNKSYLFVEEYYFNTLIHLGVESLCVLGDSGYWSDIFRDRSIQATVSRRKAMAQVLNPCSPQRTLRCSSSIHLDSSPVSLCTNLRPNQYPNKWNSLQQKLKSHGRYSCLFSDNRREEQAKKALESALGGKKNEFDKWNKEIQKREALDVGGNAGGGGWFGWGRWFGGSNGDNFWQEAQQAGLAILGIVFMYLVIAKGEVMLAVIFNPLLFALRGIRNSFTVISSHILGKISPTGPYVKPHITLKEEFHTHVSAKESVIRKWGSD
ncbi:uncharacterized protein LOC122061165 [Macadamia integrifolia]|uniref:uncharacterized protein LOC122061165 n=1 Tax=Macadamia integrifolia TaxID=60698 RepID=UPI001C527B28|nr:uncharacterized protein LOC122061165 [Macadamia integrifolia]